jgi:DNA-binding MarR family transcriptional regulator
MSKKAADPGAPGPVTGTTTMLLIAAGRSAQRRFESALAERNLTLRHVGALGHLAHAPGLSYSDLARRARITPQSMHATIAQLVEMGAVVSETRGRASFPELTDHGRALLAFAADTAAACDQALAIDARRNSALRAVLDNVVRQSFADDAL